MIAKMIIESLSINGSQKPQDICVAGKVVSLPDCHAVNPGSIPGLNT